MGADRFKSLPLLLLTTVGGACTITIGPYEDSDGTAPRDTPVLPEPDEEGSGDGPALDEAQQARKEEADQYIREKIYKGGEILDSIQLPSGDVLDFINRNAFPALPEEDCSTQPTCETRSSMTCSGLAWNRRMTHPCP